MIQSISIKRDILCNTINNHLASISAGNTALDRTIAAKQTFEYIISEKQYILDQKILGERFINVMRDKLIELHHYQNVPWAYNVYLVLFDLSMPDIINKKWGDD